VPKRRLLGCAFPVLIGILLVFIVLFAIGFASRQFNEELGWLFRGTARGKGLQAFYYINNFPVFVKINKPFHNRSVRVSIIQLYFVLTSFEISTRLAWNYGICMIISASRRTDIPAFYAEWFINRIRAGFCTVPNP